MENIKLLFQLYFRPAAAMSEIIDKGSWGVAAVLMLIVSFGFQYSVNSRIADTYAVSQLDYYSANSSFNGQNSIDGELTPAQLEEAEYFAGLDLERELRGERRPLPIVGKYALYFFSFRENFFTPLISLTFFYVPFLILLMCIFGGGGSFTVVLQRSYGELATCALMSWRRRTCRLRLAEFCLIRRMLTLRFIR